MGTQEVKGATVSIRIKTRGDESDSSTEASSDDSSTESSDSTSLSSSSSEEVEEAVDRDALVDRLDEMQEELEGLWDDAAALEGALMPTPVYCAHAVDVVVAWNDALAMLLRDARPACDAPDGEPAEPLEEDEPEPGLFVLNLDTDPQRQTDLTADYQVSKTKLAAYGDECRDQLEALTTSHDMLLECQRAEQHLARRKLDDDVAAIRHGTGELQRLLDRTLAEQRAEHADMMAMVREFRARAPAVRLPELSRRVLDVVARLPAAIAGKRGWELQLQRQGGASARELLAMLQATVEALTPLPRDAWHALTADVEAKVAAGRAAEDVADALATLEANVVALQAPPDLLTAARELLGAVTLEAAQRSQTRADIENNVCIALRQFARAIQDKHDEFCDAQLRMSEVMSDMLHRTQAQWHARVTQLQSECVHPLQDMGVPFAKSTMGSRCLVEYQKLQLIVKKDLALQARARVAELVADAMARVPDLQALQRQLRGFVHQLLSAKHGFLEEC
jgi:hypothetical protein